MPFFRIDRRLYYFAHVPKAGGSSVNHYLAARFGPLGFFNGRFAEKPATQRWTRTSPQHVRWRDLSRLVPAGWVEGSFAVVRDPVSRLRSAYNFQKEALKSIPSDRTFEDWFRLRRPELTAGRYIDDNHLVPQTQIVPPQARVFRLEDGLDQIVTYLDTVEGAQNGSRHIAPQNVRAVPVNGRRGPVENLSRDLLQSIEEVYAEDFERFGYARETVA